MNNKVEFRIISFPRLNLIYPTLESNLAKMMKELGLIAQLVGKHRNLSGENNNVDEKEVIDKMIMRIFALMQTCNTIFDIVEYEYGLYLSNLFAEHIEKLSKKRQYLSEDAIREYTLLMKDNNLGRNRFYRTIALPKLNLLKPTIESNLIKMMEEVGEVSEHIENHLVHLSKDDLNKDYMELLELSKEALDVMQTCNTMLCFLDDEYGVNSSEYQKVHLNNLLEKEYVSRFDENEC